jgi:hypothetical protein
MTPMPNTVRIDATRRIPRVPMPSQLPSALSDQSARDLGGSSELAERAGAPWPDMVEP